MKAYRTRHPAERFNIRWAPPREALRLAARGRSLYITLEDMASAVEWLAVLAVTVAAFRAGKAVALAERGYHAHGGEYLLLLIPPMYYAAKRTALDWIADLRAMWREEREPWQR